MDKMAGLEEEEEVPIVPADSEGGWRAVLERRLPAARWARLYTRTAAAADAVAGVTLGLTLVPQSIAYAALADLPVQYGLYSAFAGTLVYAVLGTVREASIGPTSLTALLTLQATRGLPPAAAVLLALLAGTVVLLMGLLRLGFLVDLISPSVTSGFTSATAMIIVCAQLKGLLGLSFTAESPLDNFRLIAERWRLVRANDATLAASCCAALLLLRKLNDLPINPKRRKLKKILWLISIARNALVVLAASVLAYCTYDDKQPLFKLSGKVEPGLPKFGLPLFSMRVGNETLGFLELTHRLGHHVLLLPFVMVLANIAIAKAFAEGKRVDATQEMVSLGVCNVLGSMVSALPACGAFTRSAVSHASGVHSPAAGLYSGVITLLALQYLTEYFFYIPKACLSAVLVCAVIFMIDFGIVVRLWRTDRVEALVTAGTWVACVFGGVLGAVLGGALGSLAALLRTLLPAAVVARRGQAVLLRPRRALVFVNAEREAERVRAALAAHDLRLLLVDCSTLVLLDHAARRVLERLIEESEERGYGVIFFNANPEVLDDLRCVSGLDGRALSVTSPSGALLEFPALAASYKPRPVPPALPAAPSRPTPSGAELAVLLDKSEYATEEV